MMTAGQLACVDVPDKNHYAQLRGEGEIADRRANVMAGHRELLPNGSASYC